MLLCCCEDAAFSALISALNTNADISYDDCKEMLQERFSGDDYRRTLESKLRSMRFEKGMKITTFIADLTRVIQELYNLTDEDAIKSIAINHIISNLDPSMRDEIKILQLAGNLKLENLLELVDSKLHKNPLQQFASHLTDFSNAAAANQPSSSYNSANQNTENSDMKEIKTMMKQLLQNQIEFQSKQNKRDQSNCDHCGKPGHIKRNCFKLKTCHKCNKKGHISSHCRSSDQGSRYHNDSGSNGNGFNRNGNQMFSSAGQMQQEHQNNSEVNTPVLKNVSRVIIKVHISGKEILLLYDPGSEYIILPRDVYNSLPNKPPLMPINHSGVGINYSKFKFDGLAYLNFDFYRVDGTYYTIHYEPVLISSAVSQPIFGINTESKFKQIERNNQTQEITFHPNDNDKVITINYFKEKDNNVNSAYIKVAKATIIRDNEVNYIKTKIKGSKIIENKNVVFEHCIDDSNIEVADFTLNADSKTLQIPVINTSGNDIRIKRGTVIGKLNEVSAESCTVNVDSLKSDDINLNVGDTNEQQRTQFNKIIEAYKTKMNDNPIQQPCKIPIEHRIDLVDDIPVFVPPRRLPYHLRDEIKEKIDQLAANDFVEPSTSPYNAPLVPVLKKNGTVRLCFDYRKLNSKTIPVKYNIPRPDEIFDKLRGKKVFTVIDLQNGYYHIPIRKQDRHKTSFMLPWAKLQFKRMSQGLLGAPFTFSEGMEKVIFDMHDFCDSFFDDLIVFSDNIEQHLKHLEKLFTRLSEYGLFINFRKCQFIKNEVLFLGHLITSEGLKPSIENVKKILDIKTPT